MSIGPGYYTTAKG